MVMIMTLKCEVCSNASVLISFQLVSADLREISELSSCKEY